MSFIEYLIEAGVPEPVVIPKSSAGIHITNKMLQAKEKQPVALLNNIVAPSYVNLIDIRA